jgi:hypothetical protein
MCLLVALLFLAVVLFEVPLLRLTFTVLVQFLLAVFLLDLLDPLIQLLLTLVLFASAQLLLT